MNIELRDFEARQIRAQITHCWSPEQARVALHREAREGLLASPKELSPRWMYDARGSRLFDSITRLPEYYPTRTELSILHRHAKQIVRRSGAEALVELGSGTSEKTLALLDAFTAGGQLGYYTPFDVCGPFLALAANQVSAAYPSLLVDGVVGDFERHLCQMPEHGRRLVAFLGSTVGNLRPKARARFYQELSSTLGSGEWLLLGVDLLKDRTVLHDAYNDAQGVTAEFNLNVLRMLNRELSAQFIPDHFRHLARFDEEQGHIEMFLQSTKAQATPLPELGITVRFEEGECLRTEISTKFRPDQVEAELAAADFGIREWWTDEMGYFALTLVERL